MNLTVQTVQKNYFYEVEFATTTERGPNMKHLLQHESYTERLKRKRRELQEQRQNQQPPLTLEQQINEWWEKVPASEKSNKWHMDFFVKRFGGSSAKLGPALDSLGWERGREWTPGKPHRRYWVKTSTRPL
jgi:hypothetical protein